MFNSPRVHFMRNALSYVPKGQNTVVAAAIRQVFLQPDQKSATQVWRQVADQLRTRWPKLASPQGLFARQRFLGHKRNMGYATRFNRAIGSLSGWNSPAGSRLACSQR